MSDPIDVPVGTTSSLTTRDRLEYVPVDPRGLGGALGRRSLMLGAGAAAVVAGAALTARPAEAAPRSAAHGGTKAQASPVTTTLASAPISGYTYHHASWLDFQLESGSGGRSWGGYGAYGTASATLWATLEIPAGALVRDVEWYVRNTSAGPSSGLARIWAAGTGTLYSTLVDTPIPVGSGGVVATRSVVRADAYGPHPLGTKLALGISTTSDAAIQVNGVRVGFSQGAGSTGLLPTPVRAYDSRLSEGRLDGGSVRTITLPASVVRPGTSGVIVNLTSVGSVASGYLKAYSASSPAPAVSALNYQAGTTVANAAVVGVSSSRRIKIYASKATHVIVDIAGTIG
ncbi:hypothetical protein [uncultured Friedmanniella sp.]|uniref:hypothetical protein n=1 Tax=uncultured Friedmanniella sp. TaxID=335381 RepID=UPI0035C9A146